MAFSPDGATLLTGSEDSTLLLWNVRGADRVAETISAEQMAGYWEALADADARVATGAMQALLAEPDGTLKYLESALTSEPATDPADLPALVAGLTSDDVHENLKSAARLYDFGEKAAPDLFQALAVGPDPAIRKRIESVLETIGEFPVSADNLRRSRAIQILETIGGENSLSILATLVPNDRDTRTADEAAAAIKRIEQKRRRTGR